MKRNSVFAAVSGAAAAHRLLSAGTLLCAAASVLASSLASSVPARKSSLTRTPSRGVEPTSTAGAGRWTST